MEEIVSVPFRRVERSYFSTRPGWRLATFEEATNGLEMIKEHNILEKWDRVRLLDGWMLGPGYDFKMGNDFKGCLGYMLLIQTYVSGFAYADVNISDPQKQVALFLCADDCNYEVVYWLFNSWAKTDSMDLQDVVGGRIPYSNPEEFVDMNRKVCSLARKLGDKGPVSEKAAKARFSGRASVKDVLSDMINIVNEENLEQYRNYGISSVDYVMESCFPRSLEPDWLKDFARQEGADWINIADTFWNFLSECFAGSMVQFSASHVLANICKQNNECDLKTITSSQENFMVASLILFSLSLWRNDIIHIPLAHGCSNSCAEKILCYVASNNRPADLQRFNETLENNAMWRCYDHIANYDLLNKLLVLVATGRASNELAVGGKTHLFVVNRLLECGAQPGPAYSISDRGKVTALSAVIRYISQENNEFDIAKSLLNKCDEKQQEQLANTPDERKQTALHRASHHNEANTCQMLLDYGAKLDVQDKDGKTVLHVAVEEDNDTVLNVFMEHPRITELVDLKDIKGMSPLDIAVASENEKIVAMLLFKSKQPEAYFDKVNLEGLLRCSLPNGFVYTVKNLFEKGTKLPAGECDDEGKTVLHLAAMCEDGIKAMEMVNMVFENIKVKESLVTKQDRRGRTALHEAALNGNQELCTYLLNINPKIISLKDKDGRTSIYDAIEGEHNEKDVLQIFLEVSVNTDSALNFLADRNGLTPLHIAASLGKKDLVELLLSKVKEASEYLKRSDFLGQTALHKATNCGDLDTVELLLKGGAHPLEERDCDGRTALHYAVEAEGDREKLTELLIKECRTNEEKCLLLWASAAGLGTAECSLSNDDPLQEILVAERNKIKEQLTTENLLKIAAIAGDIEMTKELIARGYQMADIQDTEWRNGLTKEEKNNITRVLSQLERIAQQANDQPTILDNLGRIDYAHGLAALLLNPYIKPPIVVGISGSWGTGKSSLMVQTESILLKTAAQVALLPSAKLSSSSSELPGISTSELSIKGKKKYEEIKRHVDFEQNGNRTLISIMMDNIWSWVKKFNKEESSAEIGQTKEDSLGEFLNTYKAKYRKIFKSLAAMDSRDMFTTRTRKDQDSQDPHSKSVWRTVRDMVLSAINLVLAVCEISVVLGIDKGMIERAIIKKYGDMKMNRSFKDNQELADKYLQKIIQLPLDLPDPSEEQSKEFLEGQLGVFKESSESAESKLESRAVIGQSGKLTSSNIKGGETGLEIVSEVSAESTDMHHATMITRYNHTSKILQFVNQLLCKISPSSLNTFCGRKSETEPAPHDAQQVGDVPIPKDATNKISNKDYWSWIPLRELLFVRYSKGEQDAFCYFQKLSTNSRKFPREWKRFLNYHRLVWYIFYLTGEAKDLAGWQVQFISWIFVCWEWQENMNFIIQNWNELGVLKSAESSKPSLCMIVDHFIELEDKKHKKGIEIGLEKGETKKAILGDRDINDKNNVVGSSKTKQDILEKNATEIVLGVNAGPLEKTLEKTLKDELDELKKEIKEELKKEIRDLKLDELKEEIKDELKKLDELKKEMKDLKDQVMKQNNMKNEKREEEKKMKLKQWKKMRSALYKYDVTMEGILAFQRLRFYCIAGHLSWPLPEQENN